MDFKDFNSALTFYLNLEDKDSKVVSAAKYMILSGGKRLRPQIFLALCSDLGISHSNVYPAAIAIEAIHTASLIHDDLPALDNDNYRRGKESCHKKYTEAEAILAGDFLISWAFKVLVESTLSERVLVKLVRALANVNQSICRGQALDVGKEEKKFEEINALKTGAIFAFCFYAPVVMREDLAESISAHFKVFGLEYGQYFQILNDHLDLLPDPSPTGRQYSSDIKNSKNNFLSGKDLNQQKDTLQVLRKNLDEKFVNLEASTSADLIGLRQLVCTQ